MRIPFWLVVPLLVLAACSSEQRFTQDEGSSPPPAAVTETHVAADAAANDDTDADDAAAAAPMEAAADAAAAAVEELPAFPLPAPRPSVRANLSLAAFPGARKVGDVAARLGAAFERAGYEDLAYYGAPGGFAVVTEPERIRDDGAPFSARQRWVFEASPLLTVGDVFADFPGGLLQRLREADPGRYRLLVFLVTTRPVTSDRSRPGFEQIRALGAGGGDFLPPEIGQIALTPRHNISVLVYEFRRQSVSASPELLQPGALSARQHLASAGLF